MFCAKQLVVVSVSEVWCLPLFAFILFSYVSSSSTHSIITIEEAGHGVAASPKELSELLCVWHQACGWCSSKEKTYWHAGGRWRGGWDSTHINTTHTSTQAVCARQPNTLKPFYESQTTTQLLFLIGASLFPGRVSVSTISSSIIQHCLM